METLGPSSLRALRVQAGWSLSAVAARCGLSVLSLSAFERGRMLPAPAEIQALVQAFGLAGNTGWEDALPSGLAELLCGEHAAALTPDWIRTLRRTEFRGLDLSAAEWWALYEALSACVPHGAASPAA